MDKQKELMKLDLNKTIDFDVVGDIKPTIVEILGFYETEMWGDCTVHLKHTNIELPAYWRYLTYRGWNATETDKRIIKALYSRGLIRVHEIR